MYNWRRQKELQTLKSLALYRAFTAPVSIAIPVVACTATFLVYSTYSEIEAGKAFGIVGMFGILQPPFVMIPIFLNLWAMIKASLSRYDAMLGREKRTSWSCSTTSGSSTNVFIRSKAAAELERDSVAWRRRTGSIILVEEAPSPSSRRSRRFGELGDGGAPPPRHGLFVDGLFEWVSSSPSDGTNNDLVQKTNSPLSKEQTRPEPRARGGGAETFQLRCSRVVVEEDKLSCIIGPVGSGKTAFLSVFLGEMKPALGGGQHQLPCLMSMSSCFSGGRGGAGRRGDEDYTERGGQDVLTRAYVGQTAFIQNLSVRDNICFGFPYASDFYRTVVACML